jgi:hypothetical protein
VSEVHWQVGETIALRYFPNDKLRWVKPVRVIEDSDEVIALFLAVNTIIRKPVHPESGREIDRSLSYAERFSIGHVLGDGIWDRTSVLMLTRPGAAHSWWAFWGEETWDFLAWYVNLQAPLARTTIGFDTEDHVLDLVIEPDLSTYQWKDEHELVDAVRVGRFTEEQARKIRAEGERAIEALQSRAWPLRQGWEDWRPDPTWALQRPIAGWEDVPRGSRDLIT